MSTWTANPIIVTQKRLQIRAGLFVTLAFSFVIGALALLYFFMLNQWTSPQSNPTAWIEVGSYMFLMGCQGIMLFYYNYYSASRVMQAENQNGLLLQNCLSPMKSSQLIVGYWIGPALRFYLASTLLALIALILVLSSNLNFTYWLQSQVLLLTATPIFAFLGILIGLHSKKGRAYQSLGIIAFLGIWSFSYVGAGSILNFIVPFYALKELSPLSLGDIPLLNNSTQLRFFGAQLPVFAFTLLIHAAIGFVLYKIAEHRIIHIASQRFSRRWVHTLFIFLAFFQSGLMYGDPRWGMVILYTILLLLAAVMLFFLQPNDQKHLPHLIHAPLKKMSTLIKESLPFQALIFSVVAIFFLSLVASSTEQGLQGNWIFAALALFYILMFFALYTEICSLVFAKRAASLIRFGAFVYLIVPLLLIYMNPKVIPLFSPIGYAGTAISQYMESNANFGSHWGALFFHSLVFVTMLWIWFWIWKKKYRL